MEAVSLSQKIALNTIIQIGAKIITTIFGLLLTIFLTRYLGRDGFGDYMYVVSLVIIFGALADWGTTTIGVREASQRKNNQPKILANVILVKLFFSLLAAALMVLTALLIPLKSANSGLLRQTIVLAGLVIIFSAFKNAFFVVFQAKLQLKKQALVEISSSFFLLGVSYFLIKQHQDLFSLVGAIVLANFLGMAISFFLARQTIKFVFQFDQLFMKKFLVETFPMGLILLIFTIDNKIDAIMLGSIKGSGAVGIYAIAYRVYDVLILGAAYLMIALLPIISRYANLEKWRNKLKEIYQKSFDFLLSMALTVALGLWLLAPLAVKLMTQNRFGEFGEAVIVLRLLVLALFLAYFNHLTGYTIVALGKQRIYFFIALAALIFNVVANALVIPYFSFYGAAAVTILTEALVLTATNIFLYRLMGFLPSPYQFPKTIIVFLRKRGKIF
jgi:O-antigen/teichoic acid export membrane protein